MLKVGVLTFHRCINYGSYWQARCLAEGLREAGTAPQILDHDSRCINLAEWKCAYRPTLPEPTPRDDLPRYRRKIQRFFRAFDALPLSPRFALDAPAAARDCDVVVVGSDEVWNLSHPWYGHKPLFFGDGLGRSRLVSYAASFGHHVPGGRLPAEWSRRLQRFTAIAVRDEASRGIVRAATGRDPAVVLDPCLQFPPRPEAGAGDGPAESRYVAVYGHGFSPRFAERVSRWARRRGLPVLSIGYRNAWADRQWLDAGPHEFAATMAGARAVATNFFHGCVFALRFGRPFASEASWYRRNKLRCLMAQVGAQGRLLDARSAPPRVFDRALAAPPGPAVEARIATLRARSSRYLAAALAQQAS